MVNFTFNRKVLPVVITANPPDKEATVQELYDAVKDWADEPINLIQRSIISGAGKEDLGGGTRVGLTITLLNAQQSFGQRVTSESEGSVTTGDSNGEKLIDINATFVADGVSPGDAIINFTDRSVGTVLEVVSETEIEHMTLEDGSDNQWEIGDAYKIWPVEQCEVSGGNLVAVDGNGDPMSPIFPTPFTQIILARSSSATQSDIAAIRHSSFNGGVWIDVINGSAGTEWDVGTPSNPSNNLADAKIIAVEHGFGILFIKGNLTLNPGDDISGYFICGESMEKTTLTLASGCVTSGAEYRDLRLTGNLDGGVSVIDRCCLSSLNGINGETSDSVLEGDVAIAGDSTFSRCRSGVAGSGTPTLNTNGFTFQIRGYFGGIKIINVNDPAQKGSIDISAGQVIIDSTVSDGEIVIRNADKVTDNSTGNADIQIYDSAAMEDKLTKALGLIGHNQNIINQVYDSYGNMTSGTLRIYATAQDCENDENHIAEYEITGTFTGLNKATLIKQKQV